MKQKRKNAVFVSLVIPYLYILLVLVIVWIISSIYISKNTQGKLLSLFDNNIRGSVSVTDDTLEQIENEVLSVSQNEFFRKFCKTERPTFAEKQEYQRVFSSGFSYTGFLQGIYLYSNISGNVIDATTTYNSPEEFFRYGCPLEDITEEEWAEKLRNGEWAGDYTRQKMRSKHFSFGGPVLSFAGATPIENPRNAYGVVGVYINEKQLLEYFSKLIKEGNGAVYVFNSQNELMLSSSDKYLDDAKESLKAKKEITKARLDGEKYYSFNCKSDRHNWQYVVFLSRDYVLQDVAVMNSIVHAINIAAILIGLLLCVLFAKKKTESHLQVMEMLGVDQDSSFKRLGLDEIEYWKPYLNVLLDENEVMKNKLKLFSKKEQNNILHMLMEETHESEDEAAKLVKNSGIEFLCQKFMVVVFRGQSVYHVDALHNRNSFFKQVIDKYITKDMYSYMYAADFKTTVFLLNYDMDTAEMQLFLKEQIVKMNLEVFYQYHSKVIIGIGRETQRLSEISSSFKEALETVRYNELMGSGNVMFFDELPKEQTMYDYSVDFENRFIRTILSGNAEGAKQMVDEIYDNNFEKKTLTTQRIEELFGEISSSLNKAKQSCSKNEECSNYSIKDFSVASFFDYVHDFVYSLCEEAECLSEVNNMNKFGEVLRYINEHYYDQDLSLNSLAEQFDFKGISYISRGFKYFVNENFSSYLERIRIEKAGALLLGGMRIKDVSQKVGYISDVSFRRAFKKRMGLSPTEYVKHASK